MVIEVMADTRATLQALGWANNDGLETVLAVAVARLAQLGWERMSPPDRLAAIERMAGHFLDDGIPAPMVRRAQKDLLANAQQPNEAVQRIMLRFDDFLTQIRMAEKGRMPADAWVAMLVALVKEIARRAVPTCPDPGGGRRVAA